MNCLHLTFSLINVVCVFQEGLSAQMEVTLEDLTEDEEFDSDTVYGG